jgi:hypothetical protein
MLVILEIMGILVIFRYLRVFWSLSNDNFQIIVYYYYYFNCRISMRVKYKISLM